MRAVGLLIMCARNAGKSGSHFRSTFLCLRAHNRMWYVLLARACLCVCVWRLRKRSRYSIAGRRDIVFINCVLLRFGNIATSAAKSSSWRRWYCATHPYQSTSSSRANIFNSSGVSPHWRVSARLATHSRGMCLVYVRGRRTTLRGIDTLSLRTQYSFAYIASPQSFLNGWRHPHTRRARMRRLGCTPVYIPPRNRRTRRTTPTTTTTKKRKQLRRQYIKATPLPWTVCAWCRPKRRAQKPKHQFTFAVVFSWRLVRVRARARRDLIEKIVLIRKRVRGDDAKRDDGKCWARRGFFSSFRLLS